jgi:cis-3-alkyl-4-acyloxetan-2-one decarboxylase
MTWLERLRAWWRRIRRQAPLLHVAHDSGTGPGPVIVLIHGIASSSVTFARLFPIIDGKHRVIAIDLLGFGRSPSPLGATYTIEEHTTAVEATIRSLGLRDPFILVGHSMGSLIAARYAARNPSRLLRLVLVSPPIYVTPTALGDRRDRATMDVYLRAYEYLRANKRFTMRTAQGLSRISPIRNVLEVSEGNWEAVRLSLQNSIESQTTISDIAAVRVPVDVVYGALDPFLFSGGLRIVEQMRHVTMHRVEANDHLVRRRLARAVVAVIDSTAVPVAAST